jgi:hypothetical protein
MTTQPWRKVAELIQDAKTGVGQAFREQIATAVDELHVPQTVLERMQQAAADAVERAFQSDTMVATCVTVSTRELSQAASGSARSWGFFLINRGAEDGAQHQIDIFLYPDGS